MSLFEELKDLGVDVDGGLKRINGNEKLYTKLLGTFTKSIKQGLFLRRFCPYRKKLWHVLKGIARTHKTIGS